MHTHTLVNSIISCSSELWIPHHLWKVFCLNIPEPGDPLFIQLEQVSFPQVFILRFAKKFWLAWIRHYDIPAVAVCCWELCWLMAAATSCLMDLWISTWSSKLFFSMLVSCDICDLIVDISLCTALLLCNKINHKLVMSIESTEFETLEF